MISVAGDNLANLGEASLVDGAGDSLELEPLNSSRNSAHFATPFASRHTLGAGAMLAVTNSQGGRAVLQVTNQPAIYPSTATESYVVVEFERFLIEPPPGENEGPPSSFSSTAAGLLQSLESAGITRLSRMFPNFSRGDTLSLNSLGEPIRLDDLCDFYIATIAGAPEPASIAMQLDSLAGVLLSSPVVLSTMAASIPNDPLFDYQWGLHNTAQDVCPGAAINPAMDISAPAAWDSPGGTTPVSIAILDSGIHTQQEDLAGRISLGPCFFIPFGSCPSSIDDGAPSHGTSVASLAAAAGDNSVGMAGIAWNANIVAVKTLSSSGAGSPHQVASAIDWASAAGIPLINLSLTFPGCTAVPGDVPPYSESLRPLFLASRNAFYRGSLLVASSGNCNYFVPEGPEAHIPRGYPAGFARPVLAVGAFDPTGFRWDDTQLFGPSTCPPPPQTDIYGGCGGSNGGRWLDLLAPGGRFVSAAAAYENVYYPIDAQSCDAGDPADAQFFGGTSAAAPVATGLAALLRSRQPSLTGEDLAEIMLRTADAPPPGELPIHYGRGRLNAENAQSFLNGPKIVLHGTTGTQASGVSFSVVDSTVVPLLNMYGFPSDAGSPPNGSGSSNCTRYRLRATIQWPIPFASLSDAWIRSSGSLGAEPPSVDPDYDDSPHYDNQEFVFGGRVVAADNLGATFETYVWRLFNCAVPGHPCIWPAPFEDVRLAWTAIGTPATTAVDDAHPSEISATIKPNPIRGSAAIELSVAARGHVRATVFDVLGREVARVFDGPAAPGPMQFSIPSDGGRRSLTPGVYFLDVISAGHRLQRRFVILGASK